MRVRTESVEQGFDFAGWEVSAVQAGEAGAALLQLHRRALQLVLLHLQHTQPRLMVACLLGYDIGHHLWADLG